jgi:hypothetical protein
MMKKINLLIVAILIILLSISSPFEKGAGVCHAGLYTDYLNLYKPSYSESGSSWWSKVTDNFAIIDKYLNFWADVRAYGAKGDGITDDTAAIQNAINAVKGTSVPVFFPSGVYIISQPLTVTDRTHLLGVTYKNTGNVRGTLASVIKASSSFSGDRLIDLAGPKYCIDVNIIGLGFVSGQNSGIAAIAASAGVLDSLFKNIYLYSHKGLLLNTYTQHTVIEDIFSEGYADTILWLKGNHNVVRQIDKENNPTGTTAGAYVIFDTCVELKAENLLLEGVFSSNKNAIQILNSSGIDITNTWVETGISAGYAFDIQNSLFVSLRGDITHLVTTYGKVKLTKSQVYIENFSTDAEGVRLNQLLEVDVDSFVEIENLFVRQYAGQVIEDSPRIKVNNVILRFALDDKYKQTGWQAYIKSKQFSAENLLLNPSFEQGRYRWSINLSPTVEEYITSEVSSGLMAHFNWTTPGSQINILQAISVPSQWVGKPFTFSGKVKVRGSDGYIAPKISGCGLNFRYITNISANSNDPRWSVFSQTVIPQSAGTLYIGIVAVGFASDSHLYLDDFAFSPGAEGMADSGKFQSIELGGNSITYGSTAPTTGTWKVGDKVYNTAPAAGGYIGWVCIVAGTPGTWKGFGTIAL